MTSPLHLKVCGMTTLHQAQALQSIGVDFVGFIFYPPSKRFVSDLSMVQSFSFSRKVGVFVNEQTDEMIRIAKETQIQYLQLHGTESVQTCQYLQHQGFKIIKAFGIDADTPVQALLDEYGAVVDYFLFDTKTNQHGGSGKQFMWTLLNDLQFSKPFFLSGGIGIDDIQKIVAFQQHKHLPLFGLDINSKFETQAGIKNIPLIQSFQHHLIPSLP